MPTQKFINNFRTTLAVSLGANDTSMTLTSAVGLPVLSGGDFFKLTLFRLDGIVESGWEVVTVTARAGAVCTITREVEGAARSAFAAGSIVAARVTSKSMEDKADKTDIDSLKGSKFRKVEIFTSSTVWVAPVTGWYRVTLVGASASGGAAGIVNNVATRVAAAAAATGGGTGGVVIKVFYATVGSSYVITLGTAGAALSVSVPTVMPIAISQAGNDATDSTIVGTGVSITAGGGKKGNAQYGETTGNGITITVAGGLGGTATGGDMNIVGATSGEAKVNTHQLTNVAASGGSTCGYNNLAYSSGNVNTNGNGACGASGGAGAGGKSGNVSATSTDSASGSGSSSAASANVTNSIGTGGSAISAAFIDSISATPLNLIGTGIDGNLSTASVSGAGSAAIVTGLNPTSGNVALLGGSGGVARVVTNSYVLSTGAVNLGGSSGGVAVAMLTYVSGTLNVGKGGSAFAIIESA